ncbi:MAG: dTMP kinase [Patescibacteria group bacterium]|jgi:dTMP kinase
MAEKGFIMIDGIDGSGKSTIVKHWKEYLTSEGNALFDLHDFWLEEKRYPDWHEVKPYDFLFTSEPSYVGIGKVIREELTRNGTNYSERAIAEAFSLDRLVLYEKIILPALKDTKFVLQDRGVSTSLCYQALSGKLSLKMLCELPGNALALEHAPEHLIIVQIEPEMALERLSKRKKQDDVIFEKLDFQTKAANLFSSEEFKNLFTVHGTTVHYLPATNEIDIMKAKATKLLQSLL